MVTGAPLQGVDLMNSTTGISDNSIYNPLQTTTSNQVNPGVAKV